MAQKLDLAFQLSANSSGMAAGVAQADRELSKVGAAAKATSAEFRQAAEITAELRTPTERYTDTIGKLDKMLQKGLLSQEVYGRAVAKADAELKAATSSMDEMSRKASIAERVLTGTANAIRSVGDATKSVADAGVSVIKFGKDVAWTYVQWRALNAIRNPAGVKDLAVGLLKAAATARTFILAAKALGVGLAVGGGAMGTVAAAALGLSNPFVGGALLALNLGRAFVDAKDRAFEMAAGLTEGKVSLEQLNATMGTLQAQQIDNLAFAMEEVTAAGNRSEKAFSGMADVFVTPFVGAFAAIQSGLAGFTDGISGVMEGITSIIAPVGQALAPIFTLIGTLVEGVLKLVGVLGELLGIVLKVAGAFVQTLLSPVIVGWTNLVDTIRAGMNAAFNYIGERIDWAQKKLDGFYKFMSKVPIIGRAFAGGGEAAAGAGGPQDAMAAAEAVSSERLDMELEIYKARLQNEQAIADAQKAADSDRMNRQLEMYKSQQENEAAIEEARRKAEQTELDQKLAMFKAQRENEQAIEEARDKQIREAQQKRAEDVAQLDKSIASASKFKEENADALGRKSNEALKGNDIRSSEGMSEFLRLATGREDPAIEEYRKQNQKLQEVVNELRALQQQPIEILGAAA